MSALQLAGKFFCPRCFTKQLFIVAEGQENASDPNLECYECEYTFRPAVRERPDGTVERKVLISAQAREEAVKTMMSEFERSAISGGVRLEAFRRGR